MKKILKIAILAVITAPLFAQTTDLRYGHQYALAFTMPSLHGNARFVGMGGAFGALGGNLSALTVNPASIGIYRRSDISFTSTLNIGSTEARQIDNRTSDWQFDDRMNFHVMNFGMVNVFDISRSEASNEWKMLQFGFGVNRKADFSNRSTFTGFVDTTFLDQIARSANNRGVPVGTIEGVAYDAGLIFWDDDLGMYDNALWWYDNGWNRYGLTQFQTTETRGGINEWFMTFGGNFGDMLYLGATVGMPVINFRQTRDLREVDEAGVHQNYFRSWHLRESLQINGTGVNLKLGAIIRPAEFMRIGLAFHTPTRFALRENLTIEASGMGDNILRPGHHRERLDQFEYSLRTPMRLIGSLGFVIGRQAMIGIEYEHINFGNMRFTGGDPRFNTENNNFIRDNNAVGGVLRVGGEFRLDPVSIRLGYNFTMSPFEERSNAFQNFSGHTLSAGLGFVAGSTTIDIAYVNNLRSFDMQPYTASFLPFNRYNVSAQQFKLTFGWRF